MKKKEYGVVEIVVNTEVEEGLHPDERDWSYPLVAQQGGGISKWIGNIKNRSYFKVKKPYKFFKTLESIEEKYPDVGQFIVKGKTTIKFPEGVDDVLKRADVIIDHSKIDSEKVNVNVEKDKTIIHCDGPMGWFKETIKSKGLNNVDSIEFSINPSFLKQILGLMSHAKVNNKAAVMNFTGDKFVHIVSLLT